MHLCYRIDVMLTKTKKQKIIKEVAIHDKDTGSPDVQIGVLTKRIEELAAHLKKNPKDKHSRRGLLGMVAKRRRLLTYLRKRDEERYKSLVKELKLEK